jgi:hypothetical protein
VDLLREAVGKPAPGAPPVSSDPWLVEILTKLTQTTIEAKGEAAEARRLVSFEGERNDRANRQMLDRVKHLEGEVAALKGRCPAPPHDGISDAEKWMNHLQVVRLRTAVRSQSPSASARGMIMFCEQSITY